jgi:hypothetical protein
MVEGQIRETMDYLPAHEPVSKVRMRARLHQAAVPLDGPASRLMLARMPKAILLALLAACGAHAGPESPDEQPIAPPGDVQKDYIFCCQDVDPKTSTGENCVTIAEKQIDQCSTVLACDGGFTKKDGVVTCT